MSTNNTMTRHIVLLTVYTALAAVLVLGLVYPAERSNRQTSTYAYVRGF